jgi:hypothetical protein
VVLFEVDEADMNISCLKENEVHDRDLKYGDMMVIEVW